MDEYFNMKSKYGFTPEIARKLNRSVRVSGIIYITRPHSLWPGNTLPGDKPNRRGSSGRHPRRAANGHILRKKPAGGVEAY